MKVYISGALQASREIDAARKLYTFAAGALRESGLAVYLPHQNTDPISNHGASPKEVFRRDHDELIHADAIVAFLNEPSFGVGAELVIASEHGLEIVPIAQENVHVSRFLIGFLDGIGCPIRRYQDLEDLASYLKELSVLQRHKRDTAA